MRAGMKMAMAVAACALLAACGTGGVSDVGRTGATLHGSLQSRDLALEWWFQYATDPAALGTSAGRETQHRRLAANQPETELSANVDGLAEDTGYSYRLCVRGAGAGGAPACFATAAFRTLGPVTDPPIEIATPGLTTVTAPEGVRQVVLEAFGAAGGNGVGAPIGEGSPVVAGGLGAQVQRTLDIVPGDQLELRVGSAGQDVVTEPDAGGFQSGAGGRGGTNGTTTGGDGGRGGGSGTEPNIGSGLGGGGGGAPTQVTLRTPRSTPEPVLGAGGGGGGGGTVPLFPPDQARRGTGGDGSPGGEPGQAAGTTGGEGGSAGGAGGVREIGFDGSTDGQPHLVAHGGDGGSSTIAYGVSFGLFAVWGTGGGGGGGGYPGGGGGASGLVGIELNRFALAGGGGGGGSFGGTVTGGVETGDGRVVLRWVR